MGCPQIELLPADAAHTLSIHFVPLQLLFAFLFITTHLHNIIQGKNEIHTV